MCTPPMMVNKTCVSIHVFAHIISQIMRHGKLFGKYQFLKYIAPVAFQSTPSIVLYISCSTHSTFLFLIADPPTIRYFSSMRLLFLTHTKVHPVRRHYQRKRMPSPHMQHSRRTLHQESTLHQDTQCRKFFESTHRTHEAYIHSLSSK